MPLGHSFPIGRYSGSSYRFSNSAEATQVVKASNAYLRAVIQLGTTSAPGTNTPALRLFHSNGTATNQFFIQDGTATSTIVTTFGPFGLFLPNGLTFTNSTIGGAVANWLIIYD